MKKKEPTYGLLEVSEKPLLGDPFFKATIRPIIKADDNKPRNIGSDEPLGDLRIEVRASKWGDTYHVSYDAAYDDVFQVDLRKARKMVKVLSDIDRKTEAYAKEWGRPDNYKQGIRHLMKAISMDSIAYEIEHRGTCYPDNEYTWGDIEHTIYRIESALYRWKEDHHLKETA